MTPLSSDAHYDLLTGMSRIARGLRNYTARMIGVPIALLVLLIVARAIENRRSGPAVGASSVLVSALGLPLVWVLVFIAPVLPIVARSEIYLYLPVFGLCLLAALFGQLCFMGLERHGALYVALGVLAVAASAYQVTRAETMSRDLQFSAQLVEALRADQDLAGRTGEVTLVPSDQQTEQHLRDSIGGYLYAVLRRAFPDGHLTGTVEYPGLTVTGASRRIVCTFRMAASHSFTSGNDRMAPASNRFAGKVALVTGGSSGIGRATALAFAREGASVVIASRGEERGATVLKEVRALGAEAEFVRTDVSRAQDIESLVAQVLSRFGRLDIAVNNAAAIEVGMFKPLVDYTETEYDQHMAANLKSVWLCMKHELPAMLAQHAGVIVNTSSVTGLGGASMSAFYAAAKAAVIALSKTAALEYASRNIRVNALVPGAFDTPMLEHVFEQVAPGNPASAAERYNKRIPQGRLGQPAEAAEAVSWLCSDQASYVTGHALIVDGGLTAPFR